VNKAVTNKCLQYHNDQWFSFFVDIPGKYYINISAQQCRDDQGIQFLLIEGNPCITSSYNVLACIPRIKLFDVYIEMDSLKSGTQYLVNIDGFLGDFCDFKLQLSKEPRGLANKSPVLDVLHFEAEAVENVNFLKWTVPVDVLDTLNTFEIYRNKDMSDKPEHIVTMKRIANARGQAQIEYAIQDTVKDGTNYTYEIVGRFHTSRLLLLGRKSIASKGSPREKNETINIELDFREGTEVQLLLLDAFSGKVLRQVSFPFNHSTKPRILAKK